MSHRLVSAYLWGKYNSSLVVNHIDGNKLNNSIDNLELCTIAENIKHAVKLGLHVSSSPERSGRYKDGRCKDITQYKKEWYIKNRERILKEAKVRYHANKA